ncbi:MAG: hypothetical protein ABSE22_22055 [Xanthobacteraceae bacterium]|jgi:hypothetical protein
MRIRATVWLVVLISLCASVSAWAVDEIQVYNADIAEVGQWTIEQHLNYTWVGRTQPDFPGGLVPNHSLNGTPELAYGITPWWELGFYAPFAVSGGGQVLSNAGKIRNLFVSPNAAERNFFYGINFEWSYETPPFSQTQYGLEIRPIIGVRNSDWEFIVNPIVDASFGAFGEADFVPAVRLARNLGHDVFVGAEYYADYGKIGDFLPLNQQLQELFAVTDFKAGVFDIELGAGYGFTAGSDRFITKLIIGYAFPVPGKGDSGTNSNMPLKAPAAAKSATLAPWQTSSVPDVFAGLQ